MYNAMSRTASSVLLHGEMYEDRPAKVDVDGEAAYVVPLFGKVQKGTVDRYKAATRRLDAAGE